MKASGKQAVSENKMARTTTLGRALGVT